MAKYNLPRFMSHEEWEDLSADNLYWLENAGKWVKFFPTACFEDWAMLNFSHPDNAFKYAQEGLSAYVKRIHSDYRKMYGVALDAGF